MQRLSCGWDWQSKATSGPRLVEFPDFVKEALPVPRFLLICRHPRDRVRRTRFLSGRIPGEPALPTIGNVICLTPRDSYVVDEPIRKKGLLGRLERSIGPFMRSPGIGFPYLIGFLQEERGPDGRHARGGAARQDRGADLRSTRSSGTSWTGAAATTMSFS